LDLHQEGERFVHKWRLPVYIFICRVCCQWEIRL